MATRVDSTVAFKEYLDGLEWSDILSLAYYKGDMFEEIAPTLFNNALHDFERENLIVCRRCDEWFYLGNKEERELARAGEYICDDCKEEGGES